MYIQHSFIILITTSILLSIIFIISFPVTRCSIFCFPLLLKIGKVHSPSSSRLLTLWEVNAFGFLWLVEAGGNDETLHLWKFLNSVIGIQITRNFFFFVFTLRFTLSVLLWHPFLYLSFRHTPQRVPMCV